MQRYFLTLLSKYGCNFRRAISKVAGHKPVTLPNKGMEVSPLRELPVEVFAFETSFNLHLMPSYVIRYYGDCCVFHFRKVSLMSGSWILINQFYLNAQDYVVAGHIVATELCRKAFHFDLKFLKLVT